jgi:hypothetical protein
VVRLRRKRACGGTRPQARSGRGRVMMMSASGTWLTYGARGPDADAPRGGAARRVARERDPERPRQPKYFNQSMFKHEFLQILNCNFKKCRYQSCRGANHLQFLQRVVGVLWTGLAGNVMLRWAFSRRGQKAKLCIDRVFGGFPLTI